MRYVRRKRGQCKTGKQWYATELAAKAALHFMRAGRSEQRAYNCDLCNGWHLTSKEHRDGRQP